jgi:hypothetical protein
MTRRRWLPGLGLALAAACAVLCALIGIAVLRTASEAEAQRAVAENTAGARQARPHERGLGTRVGEGLLGIADERAFYDAVRAAKAAAHPDRRASEVLALRAQAEAILVRLVGEDTPRELRSRAGNLLGALYFEDAKAARQNPRRFLEQAAGAFQDAVLADPGNAVAKRNLELLSTLPLRTVFHRPSSQGTQASASGGEESGY